MKFQIHSSEEYIQSTLKIINERAMGSSSLPTRWPALNDMLMDGIDAGSILTIAGRSGSGKSALANMIEDDILSLERDDVIIINFSFEMSKESQVMRKLSGILGISTRELRSVGGLLDKKQLEHIAKEAEMLQNRCKTLFYDCSPKTVAELESIMLSCVKEHWKNKWIIFVIDHVGLVRGSDGMKTIMRLESMFTDIKKVGKISIIQIAQLNRMIESPQRKTSLFQYPNRSDIMGSDTIYQASDYVLVIHRPEQIAGIKEYGPNRLPVKNKVYIHIVKNREGEEKLLAFNNHFYRNNITYDEQTTELEAGGIASPEYQYQIYK